MTKIVSPAEGEELRRLMEEYPIASRRACEALRTKGRPLEGEALRRFLVEDQKVSDIVRRIKEIQGP